MEEEVSRIVNKVSREVSFGNCGGENLPCPSQNPSSLPLPRSDTVIPWSFSEICFSSLALLSRKRSSLQCSTLFTNKHVSDKSTPAQQNTIKKRGQSLENALHGCPVKGKQGRLQTSNGLSVCEQRMQYLAN